MGVPTSEVGYTSAMPRREDREVHKDMWGIEKKNIYIYINSQLDALTMLPAGSIFGALYHKL